MRKLLFSFIVSTLSLVASAQQGSIDSGFQIGTGGYGGEVFATTIQSNGKILIGGGFWSFNGTTIGRIARLNSDGSLDTGFNSGGAGANSYVQAIVVQSDGKILIGGQFTTYNGISISGIARLNSDGSLDTSFNPGTGVNNGHVYTIVIQSNGKILISGNFNSYYSTSNSRNHIARLNSDGSLDTSFDPGTGANSHIRSTVLQSDGKILIGGNFTTYNGTARNRIARLNSDGSIDTSFDPGTGANSQVWTTTLQSDGKIIIGGEFLDYNGTTRNRIARLNSNGGLDATFNFVDSNGNGLNNTVYTTLLQSDGKIIIGGDFTFPNANTTNSSIARLARLNSNGIPDTTFNWDGVGADFGVYTSALQNDGKIIIGGMFVYYNNVSRSKIARVMATSSNANLSNLSLSSGTLSPSFASSTISYTASVSNATSSITLTPTVSDATVTIKVNNVSVASGATSGAIALNVGDNIITTIATAQDGVTTKSYTITVNRAAPPNISVTGAVTSFTYWQGTASAAQSVSVSGTNLVGNISIAAPVGFEVSTSSGTGYASSISLTQSGGAVNATTVYMRVKSTATGVPTGNIEASSSSATTVTIAVSATLGLPVTQLWTDYGGFWTSSSTAINTIKPDNSHDLLAFKYGSDIYSTGVNDARLTSEGVNYSPGVYKAVPINTISSSGDGYYAGFGQLNDGIDNGLATNFFPKTSGYLASLLTDGVNGLNMGTGLANIPSGSIISFQMGSNGITASAIDDGIPDLVFVEIASASAVGDKLKFVDAQGNIVGTEYSFIMNNLTRYPVVGNWLPDFYSLGASSNIIKDPRSISVLAIDLKELGINSTNYSNAIQLVYTTSGLADPAFIAFRELSMSIATKLAIKSQPFNYLSGSVLGSSITVQINDANNLTLTQEGTPVTVSIESGDGVLSGTLTRNTTASGLATFDNLIITGTGNQKLRFTASGLTAAVSDELSVFSSETSAPTSISGTTSICIGSSTTISSRGGNLSLEGIDVWYKGACGVPAFHQGFNTQPSTTYDTTINSNSNGILNVTTSNTYADPQISMFNLGSFDPAVYKYINFRYRVVSGTAGLAQLFFLNSTDTYATDLKYLDQTLVSDGQWHTVSVNMSTHSLWAANAITGIRYDYATLSGVTLDLDFIELSTAPILETGSSITVSPTATTTYSVNRKGYNVNTTCVSQEVTVNALPVPTFIDQPNDIVLNTDASYTAVSGQSNYSWTISGTLNRDYTITSGGTATDNTLVLKWLTKGSKTVSINYTNTNNCTGTTATSSNSITSRNYGINVNGSKISNPALSLDRNGKIGSGKSVSKYGEIVNVPLPDGSTAAKAGSSALQIKTAYPASTDGVYWIDLPNVGPTQIYCLMNSNYDGGGWMLAMKATTGTTFNYAATYWTTANTLNPTDNTRNNGDAKYETMNNFQAKDMMAIWPDISNISTESGSIDNLSNWSWLQNNFHSGGTRVSLIDFFNSSNNLFIADANTFSGKGTVFSGQTDVRFYGFNYTVNSYAKMRWGFGWNENGGGLYPNGDQGTNDVSGGIGMDSSFAGYSAGDYISCCANSIGINRSARVEVFIR